MASDGHAHATAAAAYDRHVGRYGRQLADGLIAAAGFARGSVCSTSAAERGR